MAIKRALQRPVRGTEFNSIVFMTTIITAKDKIKYTSRIIFKIDLIDKKSFLEDGQGSHDY